MNKKLVYLLALVILMLTSCSRNRELYEKTDYFVEQLETTYQSYGMMGIVKYQQFTSDNKYKIAPIGRLINVRIEEYATVKDYEDLRDDLKRHYRNDERVSDVYICGGGTVMIDCR